MDEPNMIGVVRHCHCNSFNVHYCSVDENRHFTLRIRGGANSNRRTYSAAIGRVLAMPNIISRMLDTESKWRTLTAASMAQATAGSTVAIGLDP